jgi:hypothetical protein
LSLTRFGGPASFGYCLEGKKLVLHPKEAPVRKLMYDLPRLQAEIDVGRIHEKRRIVEAITEKIVVGKDEIDTTLCYLAPCEDRARRWRKGWFLRPFCQLTRVHERMAPSRSQGSSAAASAMAW